MPYESEKQRRYLHAAKPKVAAKFDKDIKAGKKKPVKSEQRSGSRKASGYAAAPKTGRKK